MLRDHHRCYCKQNELDVVIDKPKYGHHPIVHARTNTIFKVMKVIGIPHHDDSPNYF
jgi:hypothetical protein